MSVYLYFIYVHNPECTYECFINPERGQSLYTLGVFKFNITYNLPRCDAGSSAESIKQVVIT